MLPLRELNLTNRFLFDETMEDPQAHQDVLSIIFGHEIPLLDKNATEKELRVSPLLRSIRLDVFAIDEEKTVYDTEMQDTWKADLERRSRYYQALLDTNLLEPGIPDYNRLNDSYIIMIMTYDLFGHEKYRYTFRAECGEVPGCTLKDGATRIFLNTKGKNENEVPAELVNFLHYVENSTEEVARASESERIMRIHERVCKVKKSEEAGLRYMQAWEEKYYEREEGREEGLREGMERGLEQGIERGLKQGIERGRQAGIKALAETCRELGMKKEEAIEKVAQKFELSAEEAAGETEKYWE